MQNPATSDRADLSGRHVPELDGVRALAIWLVLVSHLLGTPPADPRGIAMLPGPVRILIDHGYLGVDLFFVLSGYLITGILLRTKHLGTAAYFKRFYTRRALRILPLYFVVLGIIGFAVGTAYLPFLGLGALLSANLASLFGIDVPSPAGPFWSLAVEEQFYLVWPWLVLWLRPKLLAAITIAILVFEPILRYVRPGVLHLTWYHCDGLAMGALLAILFYERKVDARLIVRIVMTLFATLTIVVVAALPFHEFSAGRVATAIRVPEAVLLFGILVTIAIGCSGAKALAFLRTPFATTTATLSYCIYLIHRPLIDLYETYAATWFPFTTQFTVVQTTIVRSLLVLIFAYAIAALSWRFFESPILRRGR